MQKFWEMKTYGIDSFLDVSISLDKIKISGYNTLVQCIDKTMQRL